MSESINEICSKVGSCDLTFRDARKYVLQLLCSINSSLTIASGGVLKDYIASDGSNDLDLTDINDTVELDVSQFLSSAIQLYGSFTGKIVFEASLGVGSDSSRHWFGLSVLDADSNSVTDTVAPGVFFFNVKVIDRLRIRVSEAGTGTASYIWMVSTA